MLGAVITVATAKRSRLCTEEPIGRPQEPPQGPPESQGSRHIGGGIHATDQYYHDSIQCEDTQDYQQHYHKEFNQQHNLIHSSEETEEKEDYDQPIDLSRGRERSCPPALTSETHYTLESDQKTYSLPIQSSVKIPIEAPGEERKAFDEHKTVEHQTIEHQVSAKYGSFSQQPKFLKRQFSVLLDEQRRQKDIVATGEAPGEAGSQSKQYSADRYSSGRSTSTESYTLSDSHTSLERQSSFERFTPLERQSSFEQSIPAERRSSFDCYPPVKKQSSLERKTPAVPERDFTSSVSTSRMPPSSMSPVVSPHLHSLHPHHPHHYLTSLMQLHRRQCRIFACM